jgi:hypothetical protein
VIETVYFEATAGNIVELGSLSSITGGKVTQASQVKGLGIIYAVGSDDYDYAGNVFLTSTSLVYYMPQLTQSNCKCRFFILY